MIKKTKDQSSKFISQMANWIKNDHRSDTKISDFFYESSIHKKNDPTNLLEFFSFEHFPRCFETLIFIFFKWNAHLLNGMTLELNDFEKKNKSTTVRKLAFTKECSIFSHYHRIKKFMSTTHWNRNEKWKFKVFWFPYNN